MLTWKGACFNHSLKAVFTAMNHRGLLHTASADPTCPIALKLHMEKATSLEFDQDFFCSNSSNAYAGLHPSGGTKLRDRKLVGAMQ